jgi:hypothetical protein
VGRKVALSWNIAESVAISTLGLKLICPRFSRSNFRCAALVAMVRDCGSQIGLGPVENFFETLGAKLASQDGRPILRNTIVEQNTASGSRGTGCQRCLAA